MKRPTKPSTVARILATVAIIVGATACESDMAGPTNVLTLADGDYVLGVSLGTLPPIGGSPTFCMLSGSGSLTATASFPVRLTGAGQQWTIRLPQSSGPGGGSLEMTLTATGRTVTGTIAGSARTADDAVGLTIPSPTTLSGAERSRNNLGGQIDGDARLESGQGSLTCRSSGWTLAPR